jgi:LacI family transcriptional regulator
VRGRTGAQAAERPPARAPTVVDVAYASGVSTATVSRVLTGKTAAVARETAERVATAARVLGYRPSEIGRSLRSSSTRIAVLLVPDATNDFCADVAISLERALQTAGLSMVLCNTGEDATRQDRLLADAEGLRPAAIVLLGAIDTPALHELAARYPRLVFINRRPPPAIKAPYVGIDNRLAGRAVAEHFLARGYTDCAIIHGPQQFSASRRRLEGFLARLSEAGPALPVRQIESALTMEAGYEHGRTLLASAAPPRAVFCGNDMIAYGIFRACNECGVRLPDDLAVFGFDDNRVNAWLAPWLTTVHVPVLDFGPAVVSILTGTGPASAKTDVILPFELTIRSSA